MLRSHPSALREDSTIAARSDRLRAAVWLLSCVLLVAASLFRRSALKSAGSGSLEPMLTLAAVIAAGLAADRLGAFTLVARLLLPRRTGRTTAAAAVLLFTAAVSGLVNLDVAVVVAVPVALRVARSAGLHAGRLALAVALTCNATSFLLPTSNVTTLLVLSRSPMGPGTYVSHSWLAWLLVTVVTTGALAFLVAAAGPAAPRSSVAPPRRRRVLADLVPIFGIVAAIRALTGGTLTLTGGLAGRLGAGVLIAATLDNLPAAAALRPAGSPWAEVLALALGPNLLITGSIAGLIARGLAAEAGVRFGALSFTLVGAVLLPLQLAIAVGGLMATGAGL